MPTITIEVTEDQDRALSELVERGVAKTKADIFKISALEALGLMPRGQLRLMDRLALSIVAELHDSSARPRR